MNEHSIWRISLAHKIAPAFTINPKIEACFVFGSVAEVARSQDAILMTKDSDFVDLVERLGAPPKII
jgi:hypothetical protein